MVEVGALDVNGSLRPHVEALGPASYHGTDLRLGPGVDEVIRAEDLPARCADVLICTEVLEHALYWKQAVEGIWRALRPGGLLALTTRAPGFPRHDHPADHWRFTMEVLGDVFYDEEVWLVAWVEEDPDPASPGVFVEARRAPGHHPPNLRSVHAQRAPAA